MQQRRHGHQEFIRFLNVNLAGRDQGSPCRRRQLCHPQASKDPSMAGVVPALKRPLDADICLLAECGRRLFRKADQTKAQMGGISLNRRTSGRDQPINHCLRDQLRSMAVQMDKERLQDFTAVKRGHPTLNFSR
jgi:hypothetical protein